MYCAPLALVLRVSVSLDLLRQRNGLMKAVYVHDGHFRPVVLPPVVPDDFKLYRPRAAASKTFG